MATQKSIVQDFIKRKLAVARAGKGWSWKDVSNFLAELSIQQSDSSLMTKNSRGSFKVQDYFLMMKALGVTTIDLGDLHLPEFEKKIGLIETAKASKIGESQR